jgi:peroxiredoxin
MEISMRTLLAAAIVALLASFHVAVADDDLGPATGTKAPDIGTPLDQSGKPRSFASLMGDKGTVFFFFRSAAWCPYCQAQLMELNTGVSDMEKRGYHLVGLSYDTPDVLEAFSIKRGLTYTLLSDPKSEVIDRYGLRDPRYAAGSKAYGVPRPIIFVVGRDGTIKAKLFEDTFKKRPPLSLVLETLDKLAAALGSGS